MMIEGILKKGSLVALHDGWYFRAQDVQEASTNNAAIHYRIHINKIDKALLLESQGKTENRVCWTALVNGEVIIIWEDNIVKR
jgi:hypothetical protein